MSERELPEALRYFIARYIVSVEKLEILVLLSEDVESVWTVESVFKVIQSSRLSVERWLKELAVEKFLQEDRKNGIYRYQPHRSSLADEVSALTIMYRERPTRVIEAIFSQSTDQLRKFSDAFRFRKDS